MALSGALSGEAGCARPVLAVKAERASRGAARALTPSSRQGPNAEDLTISRLARSD